MQERNALLERGLAASEEELARQSRWANQTASQLHQSLVKLTQLERIDGGTVRVNGTELESYAEMIELQVCLLEAEASCPLPFSHVTLHTYS